MDTVGTLGQHEFAFGFCGSTRSIVAAGICALGALFVLYTRQHKLPTLRTADLG